MKLASLLVPAYLPRAYVGATPTPYQSGTVDKFERDLAAMSPFVIRNGQSCRLTPDPAARFVNQQIVTRYDLLVDPETTTLADAIGLTLKSFGLDKVTVIFDDADAEDFNTDRLEELTSGLHPWSDA